MEGYKLIEPLIRYIANPTRSLEYSPNYQYKTRILFWLT